MPRASFAIRLRSRRHFCRLFVLIEKSRDKVERRFWFTFGYLSHLELSIWFGQLMWRISIFATAYGLKGVSIMYDSARRDEMIGNRISLTLFLKEDMERISSFRPALTLLPTMPALDRVSMQKMPFAGMVNPGEASGKCRLDEQLISTTQLPLQMQKLYLH